MRAYVYVDGFNLYYRGLRPTPYKWLDLRALGAALLDPSDSIDVVRYFTARVSARAGDPDAPRRQQIYLSALLTVPNIAIHYGRMMAKTKRRPLASNPVQFVQVLDTEEKGSDVNLASHLLLDGFKDRYDVALVLSQDTDLIEPMRMVKQELNKIVGLIWLDGRRPDATMAAAASFVRHASKAKLAIAQFPDPITKANGTVIAKPAMW
jgi:hypothetical protein